MADQEDVDGQVLRVDQTVTNSLSDAIRSAIDGSVISKIPASARRETDDEALWILIRNKTSQVTATAFIDFIDRIACAGNDNDERASRLSERRNDFRLGRIDAYQFLRSMAEAFVYTRCAGVWSQEWINDVNQVPVSRPGTYKYSHADDGENGADPIVSDETNRLERKVTREQIDKMITKYLDEHPGGPDILPYLHRVLPPGAAGGTNPLCSGIFNGEFAPCFIELLWSYWQEEAGLVQTMNAISLRFQNRRSSNGDPLTNLTLNPLRPLNNLLWGYIQDEKNRLTLSQRAYEYDSEYGLRLIGKAVPQLQPADSRTQFIEQFHTLLRDAGTYYRQLSDRTFEPDPYPVLTSLRELHHVLSMGMHNQYGDLPWTARVEMLVMQWILSQPEIREFLGNRPMVTYAEPWMGQVEGMRRIQKWDDAPITQYHDLAVFGERLLLSVRFADWNRMGVETESAANWARYWRTEIQGYIHAYRAVTGVDLSADPVEARSADDRNLPPAVHMMRRRSLVAARNGNGRNGSR